MKLKPSVRDALATMVCGDKPHEVFGYRSSSHLTKFFRGLDFDYRHDGSTRSVWVENTLSQIDVEAKGVVENGVGLGKVITHLVAPEFYLHDPPKQEEAAKKLNDLLKASGLSVALDPSSSVPSLYTISGSFISSAVSPAKVEKKITFAPSVFKVPDGEVDDRLVSVMMPFAAEFAPVYAAIKAACDKHNFKCRRVDDMWKDSTIIQDIFELIYCSHIVVTDFSGMNSNVMYETGIAHTLGKHVIPISQSIDAVPFDLRAHRILRYLNNGEGRERLTNELARKLGVLVSGHKW